MAPTNPFDFSDFGGPVPGPVTSRESAGTLGTAKHHSAATNEFDPFAGQPPQRLSPGETFADVIAGSPGAPARTLTVGGPPIALFAAAFAAAFAGCVLGAVATARGSVALLAFAGWLLAGPTAIGGLAWFSGVDTRRRLSSVYSAPTWLHTAYWVVLATCAVGIGLGAWQIALWAGRQ